MTLPNSSDRSKALTIFYPEIIVDVAKVAPANKAYQPILVIVVFLNEAGSDGTRSPLNPAPDELKTNLNQL